MREEHKHKIVELFIEQGYLLSPDVFTSINDTFDTELATNLNNKILSKEKPIIISNEILTALQHQGITELNWGEFEKSKVHHEKGKNNKVYGTFLELLTPPREKKTQTPAHHDEEDEKRILTQQALHQEHHTISNLTVLKTYEEESKKREVKHFVAHHKNRYETLKRILMNRPELQTLISINRLQHKKNGEKVALVGSVYDIRTTKNGNTIITLEDPTGQTTVLFKENTENLDYLCLDEIIGITGATNKGIVFANTLFFPEIPEPSQPKKTCNDEAYAAIISDVHVGSKIFTEKSFRAMINWLNGTDHNPSREQFGLKVKYLFIVGDVVDGIGVYPEQDKELLLPDIQEQYNKTAELLSMIRPDILMALCPGNHDARRISEPQPALSHFAESLKKIPNLTLVSNPALINIHASESFPGFNVLLYHGYSYDYYISTIEKLRKEGGYDNITCIMKFLLQKRHLAPAHASTLYIPSEDEDALVIDTVPDIFISGHVHKSSVSTYKGVTLIGSSCWQKKTLFQERCGHHPDPGKLLLFHFKTGRVVSVDFSGDEDAPQ